jgi:CCR4-NOT transcriptional regulation complex NOT5 subunit
MFVRKHYERQERHKVCVKKKERHKVHILSLEYILKKLHSTQRHLLNYKLYYW